MEDRDVIMVLPLVLSIAPEQISGLLIGKNALVRYEFRALDYTSAFSNELNLFLTQDYVKDNKAFECNLQLALKLSNQLSAPIILDDGTDDPYQWLLVENDRLYWVEEEAGNTGISIGQERIELDWEKSLELIRSAGLYWKEGEQDSLDSPQIRPATRWLECKKESWK